MMAGIEDYIAIDKCVDGAEDAIADNTRESLRARWEFGKLMLAERVGKQLPAGRLDELCTATGKSRSELKYRVQFAEKYRTEDEVATAVATLGSWRRIKRSLAYAARDKPGPGNTRPPRPNAKHDQMIDLADDGLTREQIAEETGLSEHTVRRELERESIARETQRDAAPIDWSTLPGPAKAKEQRMRGQISRELEGSFNARVADATRQEVDRILEGWVNRMKKLSADVTALRDSHHGALTRTQFDVIRSCLHPDSRRSVSDAKLAEAFRIFNEAEIRLRATDAADTTPRLPTLDELLKRRKKHR